LHHSVRTEGTESITAIAHSKWCLFPSSVERLCTPDFKLSRWTISVQL
jgi:hypothetical protein